MPRKPDEPCLSCGNLMFWQSTKSSPRGEGMCKSCRGSGWTVTNGRRDFRGLLCPGCGWWFVPRTVGTVGGRTATCSQLCAAAGRQLKLAKRHPDGRVCRLCPAVFVSTAPNRRYCDTCAYGRTRDRYRKRTRDVAGYYRSVRAFPIHELGDRDRWTCHLCGEGVDPRLRNRHPGMASYDHVIPSSLGGSDEPDNLKLAHLICNSRRRASALAGAE